MSNELTVRQKQETSIVDWQMCKEFGEYAARSGMGNQYDTAIKAYAATELGLSVVAGQSGIYIIEGKPTVAPRLAWAKIVSHPQFDGYKEERLANKKGDFYGWKITLSRKNGITETRQFTLDDAKRIKNSKGKSLLEKDNWKNYPENVCYWRAMGFVQDVVFPDVTLGLYRSDELGASITPEGDVLEPENDIWKDVTPIVPDEPTVIEQKPQSDIPDYGWTLPQLLETVNESEVLAVMDGEFPITQEQINLAVHRLIEAGKIASEETDRRVEEKLDGNQNNN